MQIIPDDRVIIAGFLVVFDLVGTFVFALSGAVAGIRHRLDLFGVLVLSFAAATSGGVLRDVLIGSSFVPRFLNKGSMREALERIPVTLVEHGQLGVIGAARWYLGQQRAD